MEPSQDVMVTVFPKKSTEKKDSADWETLQWDSQSLD